MLTFLRVNLFLFFSILQRFSVSAVYPGGKMCFSTVPFRICIPLMCSILPFYVFRRGAERLVG
jgi:hypothetical protein